MKRPSRKEVQVFGSAADFRRWLEANHATKNELWVGTYKKGVPKTSISYAEAVDEALCFGWIDSLGYRIDDEVFAIRYTPRRPRSNWTVTNVARFRELQQAGRVHPAGRKAFEAHAADKR